MTEVSMFSSTNAMLFSLACYAMIAIVVLGVAVVAYISNRSSAQNTNMIDELVLGERQQNKKGYTSNIDKSKFLGAVGVCATDLRPA